MGMSGSADDRQSLKLFTFWRRALMYDGSVLRDRPLKVGYAQPKKVPKDVNGRED
jgi:hypothetical protein